jgi:hypothetical protein
MRQHRSVSMGTTCCRHCPHWRPCPCAGGADVGVDPRPRPGEGAGRYDGLLVEARRLVDAVVDRSGSQVDAYATGLGCSSRGRHVACARPRRTRHLGTEQTPPCGAETLRAPRREDQVVPDDHPATPDPQPASSSPPTAPPRDLPGDPRCQSSRRDPGGSIPTGRVSSRRSCRGDDGGVGDPDAVDVPGAAPTPRLRGELIGYDNLMASPAHLSRPRRGASLGRTAPGGRPRRRARRRLRCCAGRRLLRSRPSWPISPTARGDPGRK